jgi:hypothetical protein
MSSSTDIAAVYHEFTEALTQVLAENAVWRGAAWPARKGARRRQEASRLQRVWISPGGRNGIHKLGSYTKHRSLGPARYGWFTEGCTQKPSQGVNGPRAPMARLGAAVPVGELGGRETPIRITEKRTRL